MAALIGAGLSIRHLWIQNKPEEEVPECGPGLSYIFENFPLINTLKLMLSGTGECAEVLWTFLGISIPGWTLVAFLFLGAMSLWQYSNHKGFSS
jgi:disulfide bond formation protein DsbB